MAGRERFVEEVGERGERGLLALGHRDVAPQAQEFEQLERVAVDVGEDDGRAPLLGDVDDAEQERDADAVDQLGALEVDDERAAAGFELEAALALDALAGELVDVVAA